MNKIRILFICTHNSARSIMAEAIGNYLAPDHVECYSAGTEATVVREFTKKVLLEEGIDVRNLYSKKLDKFLNEEFDYIITTCDQARDQCPFFPGGKNKLHWSLLDPSEIKGSIDDQLEAFRNTRNTIRELVTNLIEQL